MKERENEKIGNKNGGNVKKHEKMKDVVKRFKDLADKMFIVAAVATISTACTTQFNSRDSDIRNDVESEDIMDIRDAADGDVGLDIVDDIHIDSIPDTIPDTGMDNVDVEDISDIEIEIACEPYNDSRSVYMGVGHATDLGGIGTRFNGTDSSGNALFDILCGDVVVRSLSVAEGATHVEDVSEYGFNVTLNPTSVTDSNCRVEITIEVL